MLNTTIKNSIKEENKFIFSSELTNIKDVYESPKTKSDEKTKWNDFIKKFLVNEDGNFMGIDIINSTKKDVVDLMREFSSFFVSISDIGSIFSYNDIGVSFFFDYNKKVKDITFNSKFKGSTINGIKIGDHINTVKMKYKDLIMINDKCFVWNHLCIFLDKNDNISFLRLQRYIF